MSGLLIVSLPIDVAADTISWAMKELGHRCETWCGNPPVARLGSVFISNTGGRSSLFQHHDASKHPLKLDEFDTVWVRRHGHAILPDDFPEADRKVAEAEIKEFGLGAYYSLLSREDLFMVNKPAAKMLGDNKVCQLTAAKSVGLKLPKTIITNDTAAARKFIAELDGPVIFKVSQPQEWQENGRSYSLPTTVVTAGDLEEDGSLEFCPGIFQEFIPKAYELRIAVFGHTVIPIKITNQDPIDWRLTAGKINFLPATIPQEVEKKLLRFMEKLGLTMGLVDMIATPDGDHIFLEVNQQGQFMIEEEFNPEIRLLDPFVRFLLSRDPHFKYTPPEAGLLTVEDYIASDWCRAYKARLAGNPDETSAQSACMSGQRLEQEAV